MKYPNRTIKECEIEKAFVLAIQKRLTELKLATFGTLGTFGPKKIPAKDAENNPRGESKCFIRMLFKAI